MENFTETEVTCYLLGRCGDNDNVRHYEVILVAKRNQFVGDVMYIEQH